MQLPQEGGFSDGEETAPAAELVVASHDRPGRLTMNREQSEASETVIVRLTRGELEAVIIGTEASRLKPLLRPERWEDAGNAERKLFAALREARMEST